MIKLMVFQGVISDREEMQLEERIFSIDLEVGKMKRIQLWGLNKFGNEVKGD